MYEIYAKMFNKDLKCHIYSQQSLHVFDINQQQSHVVIVANKKGHFVQCKISLEFQRNILDTLWMICWAQQHFVGIPTKGTHSNVAAQFSSPMSVHWNSNEQPLSFCTSKSNKLRIARTPLVQVVGIPTKLKSGIFMSKLHSYWKIPIFLQQKRKMENPFLKWNELLYNTIYKYVNHTQFPGKIC